MSPVTLNLARRPFLNRRPIVRLGIALWVLAGIVLLLDATIYARYVTGSRDRRQTLSSLEQTLTQERQNVGELEGAAEFKNLSDYNTEVDYLNQLIAQRTFPWGRLFDRLGEVMPEGVRLRRLAPSVVSTDNEDGTEASRSEPVRLALEGVARSDDALYGFVDALFRAPDFDNPILARESDASGTQAFSLSVTFLTAASPSESPTAQVSESPHEDGATASGGGR